MIQPLPTDTSYRHSPDAGDPDCLCSRCAGRILEHEGPLRMYTTNGAGEVDENSEEYRYCEKCMAACGIISYGGIPEWAPGSHEIEDLEEDPEEGL